MAPRPIELDDVPHVAAPLSRMVVRENEVWSVSSDDLVVRLWSVDACVLRHSYVLDVPPALVPADDPERRRGIAEIAMHAGRMWFAVDRYIVRLDLREMVLADYLVGHSAAVCALKPAGAVVWSAAYDQSVRSWSAATGACVSRIDLSWVVTCFLPVGDDMWMAGTDKYIDVRDGTTFVRRKRLEPPNRSRTTAMVLVWNKTVWAASWKLALRVWA